MSFGKAILVALLLCPFCYAQRFRFTPLSESTILQREQNAPTNQHDREARIKVLFLQAGCANQLGEQQLEKLPGANVVCRLPGSSNETIIVGATYTQLAPDNWTGASLLPSLFQTLVRRKRHHTFIFVAFDDSSGDLAGAQFFAAHMTAEDVERTEAMVNLDPLGFSPTKISSTSSDKKLVEAFISVVYALKGMASQVDVDKGIHVDSAPFASLHIPQITIHSLTQEAVADLQNGEKDPAEFRARHYYNSYRLLSGYLAYLDEVLKPRRSER